jgi:hypothetical protein
MIQRDSIAGTLLVLLSLSTSMLAAQDAKPGVDKFAEIAAQKNDYRNRNLVATEPPSITKRLLPLDAEPAATAFPTAEKMTTAEQLRAELARQRERHGPFLKDLAPRLEEERLRVPLKSFDWRVETEQDRTEFTATLAGQGKWEPVTIPHYGPPMGRAVTYYRTEFDVTPAMLEKGALFVHFKGVDYKAHVFVNGALLGSHEGYFAPFEFECTQHAKNGKNVLLVKVENDYIMLGNSADLGFLPGGTEYQGDKIFACGGPCWDDPAVGWHECPPGMGIYQDVTLEARRRVHLHDLFVRPLDEDGKAEAWIEVFNCDPKPENLTLELSVFGQNFTAAAVQSQSQPAANVMAGVNCYKIPLTIPEPRRWTLEAPWLYQIQVKLLGADKKVLDTASRQFGLRSFRMEYVEEPKGRMYLNGKGIKLRGANTMGAFQQCVMRKDWKQLIDDILLAKITNMNFIRLTQTPVQPEIYDFCDRLGLMLQTDLPNFAHIKRNQYCEEVRQAEEMERLVRSHPSNVMITYMNEPSPNAAGNPQKNLTRAEMTQFFESADRVVHIANPDRVIKAVDGDYDPPGPGMPDNHCYCGWYNGHGVDLGALHKGFWQNVKPGWLYGCGEFGAEGLDPVELMRKRYPAPWLPQTADEEKTWSPNSIPGAQTGRMHYHFFETPHLLAEWSRRGQAHQAWVTKLMTEAFRRDRRMHSFAIHLFIDNFPSGWMKTIMDCERGPKAAWFAYREALTPLAVNLRTDRQAFFAGEPIEVEAWICNDRNEVPAGATLHYQIEYDGKISQSGSSPATIAPLDAIYQGTLPLTAPKVPTRGVATVRLGLLDAGGKVLHDTAVALDIFPNDPYQPPRIYVIGAPGSKAAQLAEGLGAKPVFEGPIHDDDAIIISDLQAFVKAKAEISQAVRNGARALFLELPDGTHRVGEVEFSVGGTPTGQHFVSRDTGHPDVEGFLPNDFKFWCNARHDRPTTLLNASTFDAAGWQPILLSFGKMAAGGKDDGRGRWSICQVELAGRTAGNPVATILARRLLGQRAAETSKK